jgi:hypothetical protein
LVHSLEQPVKGQREKDGHGRGEQIAHNAQAENKESSTSSQVIGF